MDPNKPVDPNNPVPTKYDDRIKTLRQRIQHKPGPNNNLRDKLTHLRVKKFAKVAGQPNQMPWNAAYETSLGNDTLAYNNAMAGINQQGAALNQEYGFGDTSNPFNRANLLQQAYQRNRANTANTYAARGQLYAGSTQNAQSFDTQTFNQGLDALQRDYASKQQALTQAGLTAQTDRTTADNAAYVQALQDALNTRPDGAPALPKFVSKFYKQRIQKAEKHHKSHRADKLRKKFKNLRNPDPMLPQKP